ncbi:hypothetical protein AB0C86_26015 [Streptomyces lavendulae]|uniref:hypothetical protein n=1 Tax=Streptomyces lavendulae TaxID=1914 RepID=UPI0033DE826F
MTAALELLKELLGDPDRCPFVFRTTYYFLPEEPDPADWRVVVETGEGEWHEAPGPITEFLLNLAEGPHRPNFLGRYRPGPTLRYHQASTP